MPDDERRRRRVGDETKERIADLASGWSVDAVPATPDPEPPARKKPKSVPPPPPGSAERKALENAILDAVPAAAPSAGSGPRAKPVTASPPASPAPPPIPPAARAKGPTAPPPTPASGPRTKPPTAPPKPPPRPAEPPLVIDSGSRSGALAPRGDEPTAIDPAPDRGDRVDATEIKAPSPIAHEGTATGGRLRPAAALRRKRGALGDVRYVFTALFGVRRSRRELQELEQKQTVRQASRRRHLVTLGRTAVLAEGFDHAALAEAQEELASVEDERSKHAGAVAAADSELERVRREREAKLLAHREGVAATDAELADLQKKLEPLEKEAARVKKRAAELRESLQRIEKKLVETEGLLVSVKGEKMDRGAIQADLATLKADRASVQRDEPAIAAELDALNPRIAAIESARAEARKRRKDLDDAEAEDVRRTAELFEAIGAKRKVVDRASAEAEAARDRVLFELGEKLYVDRPAILAAQLSPIDAIDLELGESDRRIMELREILANVDRWKLARGTAMILLVLGAAGAFTWWLVSALA